MRSTKQFILGWGVMLFVVALIACAGSMIMLKVLPPRDQDRILRRMPAPMRQAVNTLLFPHPDLAPTPNMPVVANISALLTPFPTARPSATSTMVPSLTPTVSLSPIPPTIEPLVTPAPRASPAAPGAIPTIRAPGPTQAARSRPASSEGIDVLLTGAQQYYQAWNNCGPATLAMNLSYYGWTGTQFDAAKYLKPDPEDKNVSPDQMVAYAHAIGYQAIYRVNGTSDMIKALLRTNIPVLIEKGFEPEADLGWMGHYELIVGFNESKQEFIAMDSYLGPYQSVPYDQFEKYWWQFDRTYILVYTATQADTIRSIVGDQFDDTTMWTGSLTAAQQAAAASPTDPFAWFNLGTSYVALNDMPRAATAYDRARTLGLPWRMTWYQFGWFEAYLGVGRYDDVLSLADSTIKVTSNIEEMFYYKGRALKAQGNLDGAHSQFELALQKNPNFQPAKDALASLSQ